jgi:hypothetical protein
MTNTPRRALPDWPCALSLSSDETMTNTLTRSNYRLSTIRDIARLSGVSTATVSRVVNGITNVSHVTREKVMTAVSRLEYCPNPHAAALGRANGGVPRNRSGGGSPFDPKRMNQSSMAASSVGPAISTRTSTSPRTSP